MRFVRNVFLMWLFLVLVLVVVLLYGRTSSGISQLEALGFGTCHGQPCFMGLLPGLTKWKDAISTLKAHDFRVVDLNGQVSVATANFKDIQIRLESYGGMVASIEVVPLSGKKTAIPLYSIIQLMGTPCGVGFLGDDLNPRLFYPSVRVDVLLFGERMNQEAFVALVLLQPKNEALRCTSTSDFPLVRWKGFTILRRYSSN